MGIKCVFLLVFAVHVYGDLKGASKIIGGYEAKQKQFPSVFAIVREDTHVPSCTGVLVGKMHILTACHCLTLYDSQTNSLRLVDLTKRAYWAHAGYPALLNHRSRYSRKIVNFIIHSQCTPNAQFPWVADAGIAILNDVFIKDVGRIELVNFASLCSDKVEKAWFKLIDSREECLVVGYGTVKKSRSSDVITLNYAAVRPEPAFYCANDRPYLNTYMIDQNIRCGAVLNSDLSVDLGDADSGGPLLCHDNYFGMIQGYEGMFKSDGDKKPEELAEVVFLTGLDTIIAFVVGVSYPSSVISCGKLQEEDIKVERYREIKSSSVTVASVFRTFLYFQVVLPLYNTY